jgi:hypothetical protein
MNKRLDFSHNWNEKLNCTYFTTIRLSDKFNVGDTLDVYLKKELVTNTAQVIQKKKMFLRDINSFIAGIDTGYDVWECQNIFKTMYKSRNINWDTQPLYMFLIKQETKP